MNALFDFQKRGLQAKVIHARKEKKETFVQAGESILWLIASFPLLSQTQKRIFTGAQITPEQFCIPSLHHNWLVACELHIMIECVKRSALGFHSFSLSLLIQCHQRSLWACFGQRSSPSQSTYSHCNSHLLIYQSTVDVGGTWKLHKPRSFLLWGNGASHSLSLCTTFSDTYINAGSSPTCRLLLGYICRYV